jgi:hypothetical protein
MARMRILVKEAGIEPTAELNDNLREARTFPRHHGPEP